MACTEEYMKVGIIVEPVQYTHNALVNAASSPLSLRHVSATLGHHHVSMIIYVDCYTVV
jgi:hypothetical protein